MIDKRQLDFLEPEQVYLWERKVVRFWGNDGKKRVCCEISAEAINDHFKGDNKDKIKVFKDNHLSIEHEARRKYLNGYVEADGSVLIQTDDL